MIKRFRLFLASVCLYAVFVVGGTVLVLVASSLFGYLPYSDRPGPGWYGSRLTVSDLKFFGSWSILLLPGVLIWGAAVSVLGQALGALRAPRWFLRVFGALFGGYLAMVVVASAGWYIAIAAAAVYAAGAFGGLFGALLFPRLSIVGGAQTRPTLWHRIAVIALTGGAIAGVYIVVLVPRFSQQLSYEFIRIDSSDQPLGSSLQTSGLTDAEKALLTKLYPRGVVRFGMSGFAGGSGGAQARMLIVVNAPLSARSALRQPKGQGVVYVQQGASWRRYPETSKLLGDTMEFWPSSGGDKVTVKLGPGRPSEFNWFIPKPR